MAKILSTMKVTSNIIQGEGDLTPLTATSTTPATVSSRQITAMGMPAASCLWQCCDEIRAYKAQWPNLVRRAQCQFCLGFVACVYAGQFFFSSLAPTNL